MKRLIVLTAVVLLAALLAGFNGVETEEVYVCPVWGEECPYWAEGGVACPALGDGMIRACPRRGDGIAVARGCPRLGGGNAMQNQNRGFGRGMMVR